MFHYVRWLLGFAPWGKRFECDRHIEFEYENVSGRRAHHPLYAHLLIERFIGPSTIKGVYPHSEREYVFIVTRMERIRDMESGRLLKRHRFTEWLKQP